MYAQKRGSQKAKNPLQGQDTGFPSLIRLEQQQRGRWDLKGSAAPDAVACEAIPSTC